jgi:hypothetical protein
MTTQVEEQIIIDGEKYPLINVPSLPEDSSIIQHKKGLISKWSNNRRGFQGIWEIKDDRLYLIEFSSDSFELLCKLPILADWYTGIAMVATGKIKDSSSWDIETYETEMHLTIENGLVVNTINIKND